MELNRNCTCAINVVDGKITNVKSDACLVHGNHPYITEQPREVFKPVGQNDVSGQNDGEKVTRTDKKKIENLTDEELQIQVDRTRLKLERLMQEKVERFRKRVGR